MTDRACLLDLLLSNLHSRQGPATVEELLYDGTHLPAGCWDLPQTHDELVSQLACLKAAGLAREVDGEWVGVDRGRVEPQGVLFG